MPFASCTDIFFTASASSCFASGTAAPGPVNSFAMATGGGLDYNLSRPLGIRAQGEWLYTTFPNGASSRQNYVRFTLGAVFRFGY